MEKNMSRGGFAPRTHSLTLRRFPVIVRRSAAAALVGVIFGFIAAQYPTQAHAETQSSSRCTLNLKWDPLHHGWGIYMPGNASSKPNCILEKSSTKMEGVKALQRSLKNCEGRSLGDGGVDGVFGTATGAAVKAEQKQNSLTQDGIYGNKTRNVLRFMPAGMNEVCSKYSASGV